MAVIRKICQILDTVNDAFGRIVSFMILGIVATIMCEVVMRRLLNRPQIWTMDATTMIFGCYTFMILAYGYQHGTYVCVDMVVAKMKKIAAHIIHLITNIVFQITFVVLLLPVSVKFFTDSFTSNERGYSVWAPLIWPVKLCMLIGMISLTIQVVSETLKEVLWIVTYYKEGKHDVEEFGSMSLLEKKTGESEEAA